MMHSVSIHRCLLSNISVVYPWYWDVSLHGRRISFSALAQFELGVSVLRLSLPYFLTTAHMAACHILSKYFSVVDEIKEYF